MGDTRTVWKWTDAKGRTRVGFRNETQWGEGVEHTAPGGGELCNERWLHAYPDPLLAVMLDLSHGRYTVRDGLLWECDADVGCVELDELGCTRIRTDRIIDPPTLTTEQRVEIAIRCAMVMCNDEEWQRWALAWLDGTDRSCAAAYGAVGAVKAYPFADTAAARAAARAARQAARHAATYADASAANAVSLAALDRRMPALDILAIIKSVVRKEQSDE